MAGRMGSDRVTVQNMEVLKIDPARDLLYVKGGVPGNSGVFVRIVDAVKGKESYSLLFITILSSFIIDFFFYLFCRPFLPQSSPIPYIRSSC